MQVKTVIESFRPSNIRKSWREFWEQECKNSIDDILSEKPENIDKHFFGGDHYVVYSDSCMLGKQKIYNGIFFSVYNSKILVNGRDISHKFSPGYSENIFKNLMARYHDKYKPQHVH